MKDSFIAYLKNNIPTTQVIIFVFVITVLWIWETNISLRNKNEKLKHAYPNLLFVATGLPIQLALSVWVLLVVNWTGLRQWGVLFHHPFIEQTWLRYLVGFLMLDFLDYVYHVVMHKVAVLWKFHQVHHSDTDIDVSTTLREHPGETFVRVCFLALWVFITGASFGLLVVRQTIQTISNIIAHTEIRFSKRIDNILGIILVTPAMHAVHHHDRMPYTDSNYGDVLCIWDRIFGTYKKLAKEDINYGVDIVDSKKSSCFKSLVKIPFKKINNSDYEIISP